MQIPSSCRNRLDFCFPQILDEKVVPTGWMCDISDVVAVLKGWKQR